MDTNNLVMKDKTIAVDGPRGYPLLGVIPSVWRDPLKFLVDTAFQYGDVVRFRVGTREVYLVCDPRCIGQVLQRDKSIDRTSSFNRGMRSVFGDGLLTSRGEAWRIQRQMLQPIFHRSRIESLCNPVLHTTREMLDRWALSARTGQALDIADEMAQLTGLLSIRTVLGWNLVDQDAKELAKAFAVINEQLFFHLLVRGFQYLPTSGNRRFRKALAIIDRFLWHIIDKRTEQPKIFSEEDLLSLLMRINQEADQKFNRTQLRDHLITLLFAGQETTANALAWTLFLVSQHPSVERRLLEEIDSVLGDEPPAANMVSRLQYTRWVIQETLRLYPPVYVLTPATGSEAVVTDRYFIPADAQLIVSQYVMHRHPKYWEDPERFQPERFSQKNSIGQERYAYFPFDGGPQTCIGAQLAMFQMTVIVAIVIRNCQLTLLPNQQIVPQASLTLRPRHGIRAVLRFRRGNLDRK